LPYLNQDFQIGKDDKSIIFTNNQLALYGYANAEIGQFPIKGESNLE
jgi:hypothetical protein